jgi:MerR family transcriptional regulator, light-induced transcriptional regulator
MENGGAYLRIGELGRRVGVRPELLRAWETRYGLLSPARSAGGFRLYSEEDERRVRAMQEHLGQGLSAAQAASLVLAGGGDATADPAAPRLEEDARVLRAALDGFDETGAHRVLDELLAAFRLETVLAEVVLPYLHDLGERWSRGEASVAQEHFASNLIRGRLLGLARGWGQGIGPRALLACAPGELHDLALISFGLTLRARGWRVTYLGQDTPLDTLASVAQELEPDLVVVSGSTQEVFDGAAPGLRKLARGRRVVLGGQGATARHVEATGAHLLPGDPVSEAERLTTA